MWSFVNQQAVNPRHNRTAISQPVRPSYINPVREKKMITYCHDELERVLVHPQGRLVFLHHLAREGFRKKTRDGSWRSASIFHCDAENPRPHCKQLCGRLTERKDSGRCQRNGRDTDDDVTLPALRNSCVSTHVELWERLKKKSRFSVKFDFIIIF